MKISFVLPHAGHNPIGGFKVVYEYANGLVERGHEISVIHAPLRSFGDSSLNLVARNSLVYLGRALGLRGGFKPHKWFRVDPRVRMLWVPSLEAKWIPSADAVFATAWQTAEWVADYPEGQGRKFYLIQHQESTFPNADPGRAMATWQLPLQKIVIARWLEDIATTLGERAAYIPNGLDFSAFGLDVPIMEREAARIIMLYHDHLWKGSSDGITALLKVKELVPELKATLFGVPSRPAELPQWIDYHRTPAQQELRRLYNEAALFVSPSWAEGWPLPPAEAAQCGAALCLTDIGGHREYAVAGESALLSRPKDPDALARNILTLVKDNELRTRLALCAHGFIQQFTWDLAVQRMEKLVRETR